MRPRTLQVLSIAIVLAMTPLSVAAWVGYRHDGKYVRWDDPDVVMTFDGGTMPLNGDRNDYAQHAMWTWNQVRGTKLHFWYRMAASSPVLDHDDGRSTIDMLAPAWFGTGVLAETIVTYDTGNAQIRESDVAFNRGVTWRFQAFDGCESDASVHFTAVAIHEFGHAFGLDHEDDVPCAMNTFYSPFPLGRHRLFLPNSDDTWGVRDLYKDYYEKPQLPELSAAHARYLGAQVQAPSAGTTGSSVKMDYAIQNRGNQLARDVDVGFFLSTNATISESDRRIERIHYDLVAAGPVYGGRATLKLPADLAPGEYHLGYMVDYPKAIAEVEEGDNSTALCQSLISVADGTDPTVTVSAPGAGSIVGSIPYRVEWEAADNDRVSGIDIELSLDGGERWQTLVKSLGNAGHYDWMSPSDVNSTRCRIRIRAHDPAGNTSTARSAEFTIDHKSPTITTYFASDQYLRRHFDLVLFSDEQLDSTPTATLTKPDDAVPVTLEKVKGDKMQFRAPLDLDPGVQYVLELSASDPVANETVIQRSLVAGQVGAGASTFLALGPVLARAHTGTTSDGLGLLLADVPEPQDRRIAVDGLEVAWSATDPGIQVWPTGPLGTAVELTWDLADYRSSLTNADPVIVRINPDGGCRTEPSHLDPEETQLLVTVSEGGEYQLGWVGQGLSPAPRPELVLRQNHPNPFNPRTSIQFSLAHEGAVELQVFDVRGQIVRALVDGVYPPGEYTAVWDGRDLRGVAVSSGTYFYRLSSNGMVRTRKMLLMK